ncbi:MAG: hypothetical protein ACK4N5_18980, partial [Myxococcales bacterium]
VAPLLLLTRTVDGPSMPLTVTVAHGKVFSDVAIGAMPGADAEEKRGTVVDVLAVDGALPLLWHYRHEGETLAQLSARALPLPAAGRLVGMHPADGGAADAAVVDVEGRIHRFRVGADGTVSQSDAVALPLGFSSASPSIGPSCGDAAMVLASRELSSVVVAGASGAPAALFPAQQAPCAVAVVQVARGGGESSLLFFATLGKSGLTVTESVVQARELGRAVPLARGEADSFAGLEATTMVAVRESDDRSHLVLGGSRGLVSLSVDARFQPAAAHTPSAIGTACAGIVALAAAGDAAIALSHEQGQTRLCRFDPRTGATVKGPALPAAWDVRHLAVAALADPDAESGLRWRIALAGTDAANGGALVVALGELERLEEAAPAQVPFGPRVRQLLPQGAPTLTAAALAPDARRLLLGFRGTASGVLVLDPELLLDEGVGEQQKAESVVSLRTSAAPVAFSVSTDGARAVAALANDRLAFIE